MSGEITPNKTLMNIKGDRKVVVTAGTALVLSATPVPVDYLVITPLHSNTGVVAVAGAEAKATAGSEKGWIAVKDSNPLVLHNIDLSQIYVDASVNGEGISYVYEK